MWNYKNEEYEGLYNYSVVSKGTVSFQVELFCSMNASLKWTLFSPSEVVTRLSEVCCQQVVDDGALPVIFKVLKKCNRSLPHLEVIKYSVLILYNVVKVGKFVFFMLSYFLSSHCTILEKKMSSNQLPFVIEVLASRGYFTLMWISSFPIPWYSSNGKEKNFSTYVCFKWWGSH